MTRQILTVCVVVVMAAGCEREARRFQGTSSGRPQDVHLTSFEAGAPAPAHEPRSPYQDNALGMAEGKRLFSAFNCVGCHATGGGGGIGPALMDDQWIYGFAPDQIFSTIAQGRPDGMPAFGAKLPDDQIWQIVAYVQSLSAETPRDASPGRNDDLSNAKGEARRLRMLPRQTGHR
jgi:cytochrome c oxidase cbb3-type subunit 3